jgi:hypothetical protein
MKKILLFSLAFAALMVGRFTMANAQVCQVDSQYTSPGIYPSDTLADMEENVATNQVVQFVFPVDTVVFGFTLNFDSFVVSQVSSIPAGIQWECNANHPTCHYVTNPPDLTRGCVKIYGTPTAVSPAYPAYDSIIVTGTAYVTVPFVGVQSFASDIPVYYRTSGVVGMNPGTLFATTNLRIAPMPVAGHSDVRYTLNNDALVKLSVYDMLGQEVAVLQNGEQRAGDQELSIDATDLAAGAYFLKLNINDGEFVQTKKFMTVR